MLEKFDLFHPITNAQKNRNEILLVSIDGLYKNYTDMYIRVLNLDYDNWIVKYPGLKDYRITKESDYSIFESTSLMSILQLLYMLSKGKLSVEEIQEDIQSLEAELNINDSHMTRLELSLINLAREDFIEKIYFYKEELFTPMEQEYLTEQYKLVPHKLGFVHSDFTQVMKEIKPTTIFLSDTDYLVNQVPANFTGEELQDKMFILQNTLENMTFDDEEDDLVLQYEDTFQMINELQIYGISRMFTLSPYSSIEEEDEE